MGIPFVAGVVFGVAGTTFGATMLGSSLFADIPAGSYYDVPVAHMYNKGIIKGFDDGKFHPDEPLTRAQAAVMFDRFAVAMGVSFDTNAASSRSRSSSSSSSNGATNNNSSTSSSSNNGQVTSCTPGTPGAAGAVRFSKDAFTIGEASKTFDVAVVRSNGTKGSVSVQYALEPITAVSGDDYNNTSGTLTFADGELTKPFSVTIVDNKAATYNKTLRLVLKEPSGGVVLGNPCGAILTILDNDGGGGTAPSSGSSNSSTGGNTSTASSAGPGGMLLFSANAYGVQENTANAVITVNRTGSNSAQVSVNYATSNGSATSGSNYTTTTGTLTFGAGETTKTFSIPIMDNSTIDGNKTVNLTLSNPTGGATLGAPNPIVLTIIDDEATSASTGSLKLTQSTYTVLKSAGSISIPVIRVGGVQSTVSVSYSTSDGNAKTGADYTATSGTLTFAPGETLKAFIIPILNNTTQSDLQKNVNITLSNITSGAQLQSPSAATLNIE